MDWDLKMPVSWDLADLDHNAVPAMATATAPGIAAAAAASPVGGPECSVDLKLGGLGEFGAAAKGPPVVPASNTSAATAVAKVPTVASPAARRPRGGGGGGAGAGGGQCPSCAVDGCKADLSKHRDYHRRHKVCEPHSKTPVVVVSGTEMRFCQQCSRFHLLGEFDEAKRSCRKRLDGHNRRRRKPQADSMSASFITSQQGTRFASFTPPRPEPSWSGIIKSEETPYYSHHHHHHHHHQGLSSSSSSRQHFVGSPPSATAMTATFSSSKEGAGRRFPFLHEGDQISLLKNTATAVAVAPPPPESSSSNKMFSDGLGHTHHHHHQVLDSDCALSLLSSPANSSTVDVTGRINATAAAAKHQHPHHHHIPMAQPLVPNLQFGSSSSPWFAGCSQASGGGGFTCPSVESEQQQQQMNTALVPGSNENEMNYHGIFHVAGEGSSDGTSPSIPFSWQ